MERQKMLEVGVLAALIVFLILLSLIVVNLTKLTNTVSLESENNDILSQASQDGLKADRQYIAPTYGLYRDVRPNIYYVYDYYGKPYVVDKSFIYDRELRESVPLHFSSFSRQSTSKTIFGSYADKYEVVVRNNEYQGGYFTVKFYFEDPYGRVHTEVITKHVKARSSESFLLKDVSRDRKYDMWEYEVISNSKVPFETRSYYN